MLMVMGMGVVVRMMMVVLMGVGHTVMGMLVGMAMFVVMVMMVTGKVVVMNVHKFGLLLDFSILYRYMRRLSKHLFPGKYPPLGLAGRLQTVYNNSQKNFREAVPVHDYYEHIHSHIPGTSHSHSHPHIHENQKAVVNRLSRAIGHLEKVKRMVEEGHDCSEVLIQLAAVRSALDNTGKVILKDHMRHCMVDAVTAGDTEAIDDLCQAIDKFMK